MFLSVYLDKDGSICLPCAPSQCKSGGEFLLFSLSWLTPCKHKQGQSAMSGLISEERLTILCV